MEKWVLLLVMIISALKAQSQGTWLNIDCGSPKSYQALNGIYWRTDEGFTKTGKNKQVSNNFYTRLDLLNSLRYFTEQNKNCYTLPTGDLTRYFIRTTFHYGNYDGLLKPPTFNVEIDGNKWATVVSSLLNPLYLEVIYPSRGDNISVCLARTRPNQFPFISALEAWPVPDTMYDGMNRDLAWLNSYRYNYGTEDYILGYDADRYNRVWEPANAGLRTVVADTTILHYTTYEFPPHSAIFDAVEAFNPTDSITLSFRMTKTNNLNYIEAYFTEMSELEVNQTRLFSFYTNNDNILTTSPEYQNFTAVQVSTQSVGTLTVELRPTENSTLPPIISAIEIYTASDPLVITGTPFDDLGGLAIFISTFEQLQGWSGEPCLPSDTVWQWLGCNGNDPPRVISISLSGYGLEGPLPEFSQMQALETIDLSDNHLNGTIPEFLGNLPNLKLLNLANNDFSGHVPLSITNNKKIKLIINHDQKENRTAMIIGLAVGLPIGIILVIVALVCFIRRRKLMPNQGQTTAPEPDGSQELVNASAQDKPQEERVPISTSTEPTTQTSQHNNVKTEEISVATNTENMNQQGQTSNPDHTVSVEEDKPASLNVGNVNEESNEPEMDMEELEGIPVSLNAGNVNESSDIPEMDMEELDDLVQQHENSQRKA